MPEEDLSGWLQEVLPFKIAKLIPPYVKADCHLPLWVSVSEYIVDAGMCPHWVRAIRFNLLGSSLKKPGIEPPTDLSCSIPSDSDDLLIKESRSPGVLIVGRLRIKS